MAESTPNPQDEPTPEPSAEDAPVEDGAPVDEETEEALRSVGKAADEISTAAMGAVQGGGAKEGKPLDLPEFDNGTTSGRSPSELSLLDDINLDVTVELGRTRMYVEDVLKLNENSVVELEKAAGDPVDIYVNNRHIARGEVLVLNENFCVRISEIVKQPTGED